jgi:hypothetical protein
MLDGVVSLLPDSAALISPKERPSGRRKALGGGLPQYQVYQTQDEKYLAVGARKKNSGRTSAV